MGWLMSLLDRPDPWISWAVLALIVVVALALFFGAAALLFDHPLA